VKTKEIDSTMTIDDIYMENEEGKVVDFNFWLLSIAINIVTQMVFKKSYLNLFCELLYICFALLACKNLKLVLIRT
jgi:hypothetical protein